MPTSQGNWEMDSPLKLNHSGRCWRLHTRELHASRQDLAALEGRVPSVLATRAEEAAACPGTPKSLRVRGEMPSGQILSGPSEGRSSSLENLPGPNEGRRSPSLEINPVPNEGRESPSLEILS